jgi:hypothetical protein
VLKKMAIVAAGAVAVLAAVSPLAFVGEEQQKDVTGDRIDVVAYSRPTEGLVTLATTEVERAVDDCNTEFPVDVALADLTGALHLPDASTAVDAQPPNRRCLAA